MRLYSKQFYIHYYSRIIQIIIETLIVPVWKKSIGKYWIQYFFRSKVLEIREKSTGSNTYQYFFFIRVEIVVELCQYIRAFTSLKISGTTAGNANGGESEERDSHRDGTIKCNLIQVKAMCDMFLACRSRRNERDTLRKCGTSP